MENPISPWRLESNGPIHVFYAVYTLNLKVKQNAAGGVLNGWQTFTRQHECLNLWFKWSLLFSLLFRIHLGMASTAKGGVFALPPGLGSGNTQIWFLLLSGKSVWWYNYLNFSRTWVHSTELKVSGGGFSLCLVQWDRAKRTLNQNRAWSF